MKPINAVPTEEDIAIRDAMKARVSGMRDTLNGLGKRVLLDGEIAATQEDQGGTGTAPRDFGRMVNYYLRVWWRCCPEDGQLKSCFRRVSRWKREGQEVDLTSTEFTHLATEFRSRWENVTQESWQDEWLAEFLEAYYHPTDTIAEWRPESLREDTPAIEPPKLPTELPDSSEEHKSGESKSSGNPDGEPDDSDLYN